MQAQGNEGWRVVDEHAAAKATGLSVHTLRKDRQGPRRIPFYRIGTAIRYDMDRVRAALAEMEVGGPILRRKPARAA
jgi:hypothetical protein